MTVYKIRRKTDQLYSSGGLYPEFNSNGKQWKRIGDLKCHLAQFKINSIYWNMSIEWPYDDCEIVEYIYELKETNSENLTKP